MKNLLTGYLITAIALVLVDSIGSLVSATAENLATNIHLDTVKKQMEINKLALQQEQSECKAIGFTIPSDEEDDIDEYDD